jgi:hypothetical protein
VDDDEHGRRGRAAAAAAAAMIHTELQKKVSEFKLILAKAKAQQRIRSASLKCHSPSA